MITVDVWATADGKVAVEFSSPDQTAKVSLTGEQVDALVRALRAARVQINRSAQ